MLDFGIQGRNDGRILADGTRGLTGRPSRRRRRTIDLLERLEDRTLLAFTPIDQPVAAYLAATSNMTSGFPADGAPAASITDGTETVTFANTLLGGTVPGTFPSWGSPPATEDATPRVLQTAGPLTSETITLSQPASTFGFEFQPTAAGAQPVTATFLEGAATVGVITLSPSSPSGALLFAASTDQAFTSVQLTVPAAAGGFAIAQPRYALASSTLTLAKTATPAQVTPGGTLTYTLTANNAGPNDAINAVVTDALPPNTTFLATPGLPAGWTATVPPVGTNGTVTFMNPLLPSGATATFTITVRVPVATPLGTVINDTGTADSDTSTLATSNVASATVGLVVTKTDDSGPGSLRDVIQSANLITTPGTITFAIPGAGPFLITPLTPLPAITNQVTVDGSSQSGFTNQPLIQIDGSTNNLSGDGLVLSSIGGGSSSAGSMIIDIAITGFKNGAGVHVLTSNDTLLGDWLGVGLTGFPSIGNQFGVNVDGASTTTIGGTTASDANVIGLNSAAGIQITGVGATGNVISGNFIGTDSAASTANPLGNPVGVLINGAPGNTVDGGNTIGFATTAGVEITGAGATGNVVAGNFIGTDSTATHPLGNNFGVLILSNGNTIGDPIGSNGNGNIIGFSGTFGVDVVIGVQEVIRGNTYVGTNGGLPSPSANDIVLASGANKNQPAPILKSPVLNGDQLTVQYTVSGPAGSSVVVDFYADDTTGANPQRLPLAPLGSTTVTVPSDPATVLTFTFTVPPTFTTATGLLAIATIDANGTSAFSQEVNVGNQFTVSTTDNDGPGSLRQVINNANASTSPVTITFNLSGSGPFIIQPTTPLPAITNQVTIDGTSQPNFTSRPLVQIDGSANPQGGDGLVFTSIAGGSSSAGSMILDIAITGYASGAGVHVETNNVSLVGDWLGVALTSGFANPGNQYGVEIDGVTGTTIGGTTTALANVIGGNGLGATPGAGVFITGNGATGNQVLGNFIGTDALATQNLANLVGVLVDNVGMNTIGGAAAGDANTIAFNTKAGVQISGSNATNNDVSGNFIGTDLTLTHVRGNAIGVLISGASSNTVDGGNTIKFNTQDGVQIDATSQMNTVGGSVPGAGNTISNNVMNGVNISGATNLVQGNIIGLNQNAGVLIGGGSATSNDVAGNFIGTDSSTTAPLGNLVGVLISGASGNHVDGGNTIKFNTQDGVQIDATSQTNTVGGSAPGAGNTISNNVMNGVNISGTTNLVQANTIGLNQRTGVLITGGSATNNHVSGNFIGTDPNTTQNLGNAIGVAISGAASNTIDGSNTIGFNTSAGIEIAGVGATGNHVSGNFIGTDFNSIKNLGNLVGVRIKGASGDFVDSGNVIDFNSTGVQITASATMNIVRGNTLAKNIQHGVLIDSLSSQNTVGGTTTDAGNRISGSQVGVMIDGALTNTVGSFNTIVSNTIAGVEITGTGATGNDITGDFIGTDLAGTPNLGNPVGVLISGPSGVTGVSDNHVDGGNTIGFNTTAGVEITGAGATGNSVSGNFIGTNSTITQNLANLVGVLISGASGNHVDGGNTIVFNSTNGVQISASATSNIVAGNTISFGATSNNSGDGVRIDTSSSLNTVGGTTAGLGNTITGYSIGVLISGAMKNSVVGGNTITSSSTAGVEILGNDSTTNNATGNAVSGNFIGTDSGFHSGLGNTVGVFISGALGNTITGGNTIGNSTTAAVQISGTNATGNTVSDNFIGTDFTQTQNLGNQNGVLIAASGNIIGNAFTPPNDDVVPSGDGNVIAFSTIAGIQVVSGTMNVIRGNTYIGTNGNLNNPSARDIFLSPGANNNQPAPTSLSASLNGNQLTVQFTVTAPAGTRTGAQHVVVEFYVNDTTSVLQQRLPLAVFSHDVDIPTSGPTSFTYTTTITVQPGFTITAGTSLIATATFDTNGTSAFSQSSAVATPYMVVTDDDNGDNTNPVVGSLRAAIVNANKPTAPAGMINITFGIDPNSPSFKTITLMAIPLPDIMHQVTIDGTTQLGYSGAPIIQIDGSFLSSTGAANGLTLATGSDGSVIRGLNIVRFEADLFSTQESAGIDIQSTRNTVVGTWIGVDATNPSDLKYAGNFVGIRIDNGGASNTIGGTTPNDRNVISGNDGDAIDIKGGGSNLIQNTYIGSDSHGTLIVDQPTGFNLYNVGNGIHIEDGSVNNKIGAQPPLSTATATAALTSGIISSVSVTNGGSGYLNAPPVIISPPTPTVATATATFVNATTISFTINNGGSGYLSAPTVTLIGGGFTTQGMATATVVSGVVTGITLTGAAGYTSAPFVSIDPPTALATAAAKLVNATSLEVTVIRGGSGYLSPPKVTLSGGGGTFTSATATISNGMVTHITVMGASNYTSAPVVQIAPPTIAATGVAVMTNGVVTAINITNAGAGYTSTPTITIPYITMNLISGNFENGILVEGNSNGTTIINSFIGTDGTGTASSEFMGNLGDGIQVVGGNGTQIGKASGSANAHLGVNVISGNFGNGIQVISTATMVGSPDTSVSIQNNNIGTDVNGLTSNTTLGNVLNGVLFTTRSNGTVGVSGSTVGGTNPGEGNVISGNLKAGIRIEFGSTNSVLGNFVGTTSTGNSDLGNGTDGIELVSSSSNIVGGLGSAQNTISGNTGNGVLVLGNLTPGVGNVVENNVVGARTAQSQTLGNAFNGVALVNTQNNTVGGSTFGTGNILAGNGFSSFSRTQLSASIRTPNPNSGNMRTFLTDSFTSIASGALSQNSSFLAVVDQQLESASPDSPNAPTSGTKPTGNYLLNLSQVDATNSNTQTDQILLAGNDLVTGQPGLLPALAVDGPNSYVFVLYSGHFLSTMHNDPTNPNDHTLQDDLLLTVYVKNNVTNQPVPLFPPMGFIFQLDPTTTTPQILNQAPVSSFELGGTKPITVAVGQFLSDGASPTGSRTGFVVAEDTTTGPAGNSQLVLYNPDAPKVTVINGGGTGAAVGATVVNGVITGFTIFNGGSGYTSPPTFSITGGGGSGASAKATLGGENGDQVVGFTDLVGGSGYTFGPVAVLSSPAGNVAINAISTINFDGESSFDGLAVAGKVNGAGDVFGYTNTGGTFALTDFTLNNFSPSADFDPTSLAVGNLHNTSGSEGQNADLVIVDSGNRSGLSQAYVFKSDVKPGGSGEGTFTLVPNPVSQPNSSGGYLVPSNSVSAVVVGDFEGTGFGDIAILSAGDVTNNTTGQVSLLSNDGNTTFRTPTQFDVGLAPTGMVVQMIPGVPSPSIAVSNALFADGAPIPTSLQVNLRQLSALRSNGVAITGSSGGNLVQGNNIGLDIQGNQARGNASDGVLIQASGSGNTVGGLTSAAANFISGNNGDGVHLISRVQTSDTQNLIQGNIIGLDSTGQTSVDSLGRSLGNAKQGIEIDGLAAIIQGNTISGNGINGIDVNPAQGVNPASVGPNDANMLNVPATITGNFIGTNGPYTPPGGSSIVAGMNAYSVSSSPAINGSPLGNVLNGISLNNVYGVSIGGTTTASQNVISGNLGRGIQLRGDEITAVIPPTEPPTGMPGGNNKIYANLIGVGTGNVPVQFVNHIARSLGNLSDGVFLLDAQGTLIDGTKVSSDGAVQGVISNNRGYGIHAVGQPDLMTNTLTIINTLIGTDPKGTQIQTKATDPTLSTNSVVVNWGNVADGVFLDTVSTAVIRNDTISGNLSNGITLLNSLRVTITNDNIGASFNWMDPILGSFKLGNFNDGVSLKNVGNANLENNRITGNLANGLDFLDSSNSVGASSTINVTSKNNITGNSANGINFVIGPGVSVPNLTLNVTSNTLSTNSANGLNFVIGAGGQASNLAINIQNNVSISDNLANGLNFAISSGALVPNLAINITDNPAINDNKANGLSVAIDPMALVSNPAINVVRDTFNNNTSNGIALNGTSNPVVTDDMIIGNFADGILLQNVSGALVVRDMIEGNRANGLNLLNSSHALVTASTITGNFSNGIFLNLSGSNTIGDATFATRNIISGNFASGINISGAQGLDASQNLVIGNFIGLDADGSRLPNSVTGLLISNANNNTIGGITDTPGQKLGNVISGNQLYGVEIANGATGNRVVGNLIGTNSAGTSAVANTSDGVFLINVSGNTIGGSDPQARNIISGNASNGVRIFGGGGVNNTVVGNYIGLDVSGANPISNLGNGVLIDNAGPTIPVSTATVIPNFDASGQVSFSGPSAHNVISMNAISGNAQSGVAIISTGLQGGNVISANVIGTRADGAVPVANGAYGVFINGSSFNAIGGRASTPGTGPGNVISGNGQSGVLIFTPVGTAPADNNFVLGNLIGTNSNNSTAVGNINDGVQIINSSKNIIGLANARNVISGNASNGVEIDSLTLSDGTTNPASYNILNGNFIGLTVDGSAALGNRQNGVLVIAAGSSVASSNIIGQTNDSSVPVFPKTTVPNATNNGQITGNGNVISANGIADIQIAGSASNTIIRGNYVGTTASGGLGAGLGNSVASIGIFVNNTGQMSSNNIIGGTESGQGNLIAQSTSIPDKTATNLIGIELFGPVQPERAAGNQISGNVIGLAAADPTGGSFVAADQSTGILVNNSRGNTIGSSAAKTPADAIAGNVISGNRVSGITITGQNSSENHVLGNYIGTDPAGSTHRFLNGIHPVQDSGVILDGAFGNFIGDGSTPGFPASNVISGNVNGVQLVGASPSQNPAFTFNTVQGNIIGLDPSGMVAVPNEQFGVFVNDSPNLKITGNLISANGVSGVDILGIASKGIVVQGNRIGPNILNQPVFKSPTGASVDTINGPVLPGVQRYGVSIIGASNNTIGSKKSKTTPLGSGNLFTGNGQVGVYITNTDFNGKVYAPPVGNKVENNTITYSGLYGILFYNSPNNQSPPITGPGSKNVLKHNQIPFLNYLRAVNGQAPLPIPKSSKPHYPKAHAKTHHKGIAGNSVSEHVQVHGRVRGKAATRFSAKGHTPQGPAAYHHKSKG